MSAVELIHRDPSVTDHYGLTVIELGEDGGTLVVLGHHDDRRTLAAFARYARQVWGQPLNSGWVADAPTSDEIQRVRAVVVHSCHRGWNADEARPAAELQLVDPAGEPCADCLNLGYTWALLYRADVQDHPASFPVTVWAYDA